MTTSVGKVESPMIIALHIDCRGQERREFIQAWADGILKRLRESGLDTDSERYHLVVLSLPTCGGQATYDTVDDIPLMDVPCPCGNPNHWLIHYVSEEEISCQDSQRDKPTNRVPCQAYHKLQEETGGNGRH